MAVALRSPGHGAAWLYALIGGAFGFGLVIGLRAISGLEIFQTEQTGYPHIIVPAITAPLGFLVGLGCFDYWFRWAAGGPTIPDDHSQHGAKSWKDYFKFNTDHKVIGIQYIVTTLLLLLHRRPDRDGACAPSSPSRARRSSTRRVQRALLDPRRVDDLRVRDPGLRRARELRPAADDRRAGHGVPAPERALVLDAADRRPAVPRQLPRPRRRLRRRLDRVRAALDRRAARASRSSTSACSSRAPHRWRPP